MGSSLKVPLGVLFTRVPYYMWDLNRGPDLENYPYLLLGFQSMAQASRHACAGMHEKPCTRST